MPATVIVGLQWGDEGKGKIVDWLAENVTMVCRYQGGDDAGHTVVLGQEVFKLHLVPAGIFYPEKTCVIGNGVAVDPEVLLGEIDQLESRGVSTARLMVSERAQLIMPWHIRLDQLDEQMRGASAIGTTGKGVGPCFIDKVARRGIRVADLMRREELSARIASVLEYQNKVITGVYGGEPLEVAHCFDR